VDLMVLRSSIGCEFCGFMHFDCLWFYWSMFILWFLWRDGCRWTYNLARN